MFFEGAAPIHAVYETINRDEEVNQLFTVDFWRQNENKIMSEGKKCVRK